MIEPKEKEQPARGFFAALFGFFSPSEEGTLSWYESLKIQTALKNLSDQDKFIEGCVDLAECSEIDLSQTDTSGFPTISLVNIQRVGQIAPSALRPLLTDSRLARVCGSFDGLLRLVDLVRSVFPEHHNVDTCDLEDHGALLLAYYERLYLDLIFSHDAIIDFLDRADRLLTLYDRIPHYVGLLLGKHPRRQDMIRRMVRHFDDMMRIIERLPFIKHIVVYERIELISDYPKLIQVLKLLPDEAGKLLYTHNGMRHLSCANELIQVIESAPHIAPDLFRMTKPYQAHRAKIIAFLTKERFSVTVRLIYHYPRILPILVKQPELRAMLSGERLQSLVLPQLQKLSELGQVEASDVLAWYYRSEECEPNAEIAAQYTQLAEQQSRASRAQRLMSQSVLQDVLIRFDGQSAKHKNALLNTTPCHSGERVEVAEPFDVRSLSALDHANIHHIRHVVKQHPDAAYTFLKQIHFMDFSYAERLLVRENVLDQLNQAVEQQQLATILQILQMFLYGIPGVIPVDFDAARQTMQLARDVVKQLGWNTQPVGGDCRLKFNRVKPALVGELFRLKQECDRLTQVDHPKKIPVPIRALLAAQPTDCDIHQQIDPLIAQLDAVSSVIKRMKAQPTQQINLAALQAMRLAKRQTQKRLSQQIAALPIDAVFRLSVNVSFRKHCRKAQMADHWIGKLFDWSMLPGQYSLCGSAYEMVMGEYLLGYASQWVAHGQAQHVQTKNYLDYTVKQYYSPRAALLLAQYYTEKLLCSDSATIDLGVEIEQFVEILIRRYYALGFMLAAVLCHSLCVALEDALEDSERTRLLVRTLALLFCVRRVGTHFESLYILDQVLCCSLDEVLSQSFNSFQHAQQELESGLESLDIGAAAAAVVAQREADSMMSGLKKIEAKQVEQYRRRYEKHCALPDPARLELRRQKERFYKECVDKAIELHVERIEKVYASLNPDVQRDRKSHSI